MYFFIFKCILNLFLLALVFCPVPYGLWDWDDYHFYFSIQQAQKRQVKPTATQQTATRARKAAPKSSRARATSSTRVLDMPSWSVLVRPQSLKLPTEVTFLKSSSTEMEKECIQQLDQEVNFQEQV
ncbi:hypothetical protein AVEN_160838-1 [Araneus ventricosus]|uniref:Uncharacterized protein n=1 Tax=Araneus ventricosus TaxID=182803 RepID=A0A4Y2M8K0_ARAVE|nr:hypothetical protein AVEN_160838-1 [Araneus ventricosus]